MELLVAKEIENLSNISNREAHLRPNYVNTLALTCHWFAQLLSEEEIVHCFSSEHWGRYCIARVSSCMYLIKHLLDAGEFQNYLLDSLTMYMV